MEKLIRRRKFLEKALKSLNKSIKYINLNQNKDEDIKQIYRDSMIYRFKFCVDLLWKYCKDYLENIEKLTTNTNSPRGVFRNLALNKIITEEQSTQALEMVDCRNQTSHIYQEEVAKDISEEIPEYYNLMLNIFNLLQKKQF